MGNVDNLSLTDRGITFSMWTERRETSDNKSIIHIANGELLKLLINGESFWQFVTNLFTIKTQFLHRLEELGIERLPQIGDLLTHSSV